jgi:hypothetical protein
MEDDARRRYAFVRDCDPIRVGFITNDAGDFLDYTTESMQIAS